MGVLLPPYIQVDDFVFQTYSLLILASLLVTERFLVFTGRYFHLDSDVLRDAILYTALGGILGARLFNQVVLPDLMWHPSTWLRLAPENLSYLGAVFGGIYLLHHFAKRKGVSFLEWGDWLVVGASLFSAILWLGVPWPTSGFPAQLAGTLLYLGLTSFLVWQFGRRDYPGQNFATFLVLAPLLHFGLQVPMFRPDGIWMNSGQLTALVILAVAIWFMNMLAKSSRGPRTKNRRLYWGVAVLLLFNMIFFWAEANRPAQATFASGVQIGMQAPDFLLEDLNGTSIRLSDLRGKPVLLNFWASWCPPCRAEMPEMQIFYERHLGQVNVVGINLQENPDIVKDFIQTNGYTWTMLLDADGNEQQRYRVRVIPTSYFLDEQGVIRRVYYGPLTLEMMEQFWRESRSR